MNKINVALQGSNYPANSYEELLTALESATEVIS